MANGHVYIFLNAAMPGMLKIGMTTRSPEERAREVSQGTGVATPFNVAYSEEVPDCAAAEALIHSRLERYRVHQRREFFHLDLRDAIRHVSEIASEVRKAVPAISVSETPPSALPPTKGDEGPAPQTPGVVIIETWDADEQAYMPPAAPLPVEGPILAPSSTAVYETDESEWAYGVTPLGTVHYLKTNAIGDEVGREVLSDYGCTDFGRTSKPCAETELFRLLSDAGHNYRHVRLPGFECIEKCRLYGFLEKAKQRRVQP